MISKKAVGVPLRLLTFLFYVIPLRKQIFTLSFRNRNNAKNKVDKTSSVMINFIFIMLQFAVVYVLGRLVNEKWFFVYLFTSYSYGKRFRK